MKKFCLIIILFAIFKTSFSQPWNWIRKDFTYSIYGTGFESRVAYDPSGNIYVSFDSSCAKYTTSGSLLWKKGIKNIAISDIATNKRGEFYITGTFIGTANFGIQSITSNGQRDIFVAKFFANGTCQWVLAAGGIGIDISNSISIDLDENIFITGEFQNSFLMGSVNLSADNPWKCFFLAKINFSGQVLWAKQSLGFGQGQRIKTDSLGNAYVLGHFGSSTTFDSLTVVTGITVGNSNLLLKYSSSGNVIWDKFLGSSINTVMTEMSNDKSSDIYITWDWLYYTSVIYKYNNNGIFIWSKQVGTSDYAISIRSIYLSEDNHLYASGGFGLNGTFCNNTYPEGLFLVKWDSEGNCIWSMNAVSSNGISGENITQDNMGNTYLSGRFIDNAIFPTNYMHNLFVSQILENSSSGITEIINTNSLEIYPNPNSGAFQINYSSTEKNNLQLNIIDSKGKKVYTEIFQGDYNKAIELGTKAKGVYFVEIISDRKRDVKRIVLN